MYILTVLTFYVNKAHGREQRYIVKSGGRFFFFFLFFLRVEEGFLKELSQSQDIHFAL